MSRHFAAAWACAALLSVPGAHAGEPPPKPWPRWPGPAAGNPAPLWLLDLDVRLVACPPLTNGRHRESGTVGLRYALGDSCPRPPRPGRIEVSGLQRRQKVVESAPPGTTGPEGRRIARCDPAKWNCRTTAP